MAFTIYSPKNILLKPLFAVLVMLVIPFAAFFSLIRMPFAKRRVDKLSETLRNDWMLRKKYVYVGLTSGYPLSDFVKTKILPRFDGNVIWDEWNETQKLWESSEPDEKSRVTTFWQDIGEDFDGDPMVIIATYSPDNFDISRNDNFYQFMLSNDSGVVYYNGKELTGKDAEQKIQDIVERAIDSWNL